MAGAATMRLYGESSWPLPLALALPPKTSLIPKYQKHRVYCRDSNSSPSLSVMQMSLTKRKTLSLILNSGVIACLRATCAETAFEAATAALRGGISVLEIVMSTPGVFQVVKKLVQRHPTMAIGVGTVLSVEDASNAMNAGAKFLMSPAMVKDLMDDFQDSEVLYIPGVMTPTEILSAYGSGAKIVKVYPVSALGGVQYISALQKPFPHMPMVASQGITIDSVENYISHGASAVVLSDALFTKGAMLQKDFNAIYRHAYLASVQGKEAVGRPYINLGQMFHPLACTHACVCNIWTISYHTSEI